MIDRIKLFLFITIVFCSCEEKASNKKSKINVDKKKEINDFDKSAPEGMVWIPSGSFIQGASNQDKLAMEHEKPQHKVFVEGFFMDITEVTNKEFTQFIHETGYVTVAERDINWDDLKTQLPPDAIKPHDSILRPGSLTFKHTSKEIINLMDYSQWWVFNYGSNWRHPNGPNSTIEGKDNYPVVHIAYEDAIEYCKWSGRRLPTESEWEYASKGADKNTIYFWGNSDSDLYRYANTWEGKFPSINNLKDGYLKRAPVASYLPNSYGLYDMLGNVWEYTSDWYNYNYYKEKHLKGINSEGPTTHFNPSNPFIKEKVIKGGSFLCSITYCASYRPSAKMYNSIDSSAEHLGFRTVLSSSRVLEK